MGTAAPDSANTPRGRTCFGAPESQPGSRETAIRQTAPPAEHASAGTLPEYVVATSRVNMPSSCWKGQRYYRVAVLRIDWIDIIDGALSRDASMSAAERWRPAAISTRTRGVAEVCAIWERVYLGSTPRCGYARAVVAAVARAAVLGRCGPDEVEVYHSPAAGSPRCC